MFTVGICDIENTNDNTHQEHICIKKPAQIHQSQTQPLIQISRSFQVDAVLMAIGICAAVTFALTIFAFQTKYDFTTCGGETEKNG
jgi:hypothetical protein